MVPVVSKCVNVTMAAAAIPPLATVLVPRVGWDPPAARRMVSISLLALRKNVYL